jgi:hypothetical protein
VILEVVEGTQRLEALSEKGLEYLKSLPQDKIEAVNNRLKNILSFPILLLRTPAPIIAEFVGHEDVRSNTANLWQIYRGCACKNG